MASLSRILTVRKARENAIRARIFALEQQMQTLAGEMDATRVENRQLREQWQLAIGRHGVLDHVALRKHSHELGGFHAADVDLQTKLQTQQQRMQAFEEDLRALRAELHGNIVGQEKLKSLVEEGVDGPDPGRRSM